MDLISRLLAQWLDFPRFPLSLTLSLRCAIIWSMHGNPEGKGMHYEHGIGMNLFAGRKRERNPLFISCRECRLCLPDVVQHGVSISFKLEVEFVSSCQFEVVSLDFGAFFSLQDGPHHFFLRPFFHLKYHFGPLPMSFTLSFYEWPLQMCGTKYLGSNEWDKCTDVSSVDQNARMTPWRLAWAY